VLLVVDEAYGIGDIFFIAYFMILCILVESGLVFADYGLVAVVVVLVSTAQKRELKVTAGC
jgi:hypothetical protein